MKSKRVAKFAFFFILVLSFVLNTLWSARGYEDDWMYWVSRYLISSEMIILGFLMSVIPRQIRLLIYGKDTWQEKSLIDKAGFILYGFFFMGIGVVILTAIIRPFLRGCELMLTCF